MRCVCSEEERKRGDFTRRQRQRNKKERKAKKKTRDTKKITDKVTYTKGEEKAVYIYIERETRARF